MPQRKIIIIGATSGIGREMAILYAQQSNFVGITGRRKLLLEELKTKYPEQIFISCFDVMGSENQNKIQGLINELGGLDLLIYNSGYGDP